jgi:hypothetical protein
MAYKVRLYKTRNMAVVKHSGLVDGEELWNARKKAMELVHGAPSPRVLVDLRDVRMEMSTIEQFNFARAQNIFSQGKVKVAVVIGKADPQVKDHRLMETIGQNRGAMLQIYEDRDEAKKWLMSS